MWIASVVIVSILFLMMFSNGAGEESTFLVAGLLLAVIVRLGNITEKLSFQIKKLETKYASLEEEFLLLKEKNTDENPEALAVVKEEVVEKAVIKDVAIAAAAEESSPLVKKMKEQESKQDFSRANDESPIDKAISFIISYFTKGNPLVKVGGILLFFGLSFLIKFAAEKDMVSTEMGVISSIVFAFVLIGLGWKHKERTGAFGLVLQGTGIAIFYLSIFSSAKYFEIIPFSLALGIMVLAVIFASFLSVAQNSMALALFATAGGFLAPIITSTGEGSHIVLFSYYALLNIGIISMAWFKSWRALNLTGFAFTFVISLFWGANAYRPELFWTTEPFLIFFFLLYVGVSVIFAYKSEYTLKAYVDSSLLFGVPATAFAMQGALVKDIEYALSFSALVVAAFYLGLSWFLRRKEHMSLLSESFLALGVVFVTLSVPFALNGHWTAVTWTLEASAIIWISLRQNRFYARVFAVVLQVLAGGVFFFETVFSHSSTFVLNNIFLGSMIISISAFLTSFVYEKNLQNIGLIEKVLRHLFMGLGLLWWILSGAKEIETHFDYSSDFTLVYLSVSALLFAFISKRVKWQNLEDVLVGFFPLGLFLLLTSFNSGIKTHPFSEAGWLSIPLFILSHYLLLYYLKFKSEKQWHIGGLWLIVLLMTWEVSYHIDKVSSVLAHASYPLMGILAIILIRPGRNFWPLNIFYKSYTETALAGVSFFLIVINLALFLSPAVLKDMGYLPFLNPVDMMQVISVLAMLSWLKSLKEGLLSELKTLYVFAGISIISLLTVFVARSVHFYTEVPYRLESFLYSDIFHASVSLLYSVLALVLILMAKKKLNRTIWIVGASLLGFVTVKLFFVELSHSGSLSRIVSFMGVGILILIIGYFAPLPPKKEESL